jgi:hypothetical protein
MRYPASEKLEIIRLVEESAFSVRWTLEKIGIHHGVAGMRRDADATAVALDPAVQARCFFFADSAGTSVAFFPRTITASENQYLTRTSGGGRLMCSLTKVTSWSGCFARCTLSYVRVKHPRALLESAHEVMRARRL